MTHEKIIYRGQTYSVVGTCKYYACRTSREGTRLLHRHIWIDNNGPIPLGHSVHHIDHDRYNNDPSNLAVVPTKKHAEEHLRERIAKGEMPPPSDDALKKAALWHASPEGIEWHKAHAKKMWEAATKSERTCQCCGKAYESYQSDSRFCSNPCMQRASYRNQFTQKKVCEYCGTEFLASKYRNVRHCSRVCGIKNRPSNKPT